MTGFGHLLQASVSQDMLLGANSLKISGEVSVSWQVLLGFHEGGVGSSSTSRKSSRVSVCNLTFGLGTFLGAFGVARWSTGS